MGVVAAVGRRLVLILSLGCDGDPSVVSGGRRFQVVGGRAVVVGTGEMFWKVLLERADYGPRQSTFSQLRGTFRPFNTHSHSPAMEGRGLAR